MTARVPVLLIFSSLPAWVLAQSAAAPAALDAATGLQGSPQLGALPRNEAARTLPIVLRARSIKSQLDQEAVAEGDVEFRRGGMVIKADSLRFDARTDIAKAQGQVRISRDGAVYSGPSLSLDVKKFEGFFESPLFEFQQLGAGGRAQRLDFLGPGRALATEARYTSCPREGATDESPEPAWELRTQRVHFDIEANEGLAEGARLRFLGRTILALPTLSFPLTDARKSGWLPPSIGFDNRGGLELSVPYFWNLAPNRDVTFAPRVITRRGLGLDTEFRYLEPRYTGTLDVDWLPDDRVAGRTRHALHWRHEHHLGGDIHLRGELLRVSDDDWWKDFPSRSRSLTARLLGSRLALERPLAWPAGQGTGLAYARVHQWQVLQNSESLVISPYQRAPQVGLRMQGLRGGFEWAGETEFNRFTLPGDQAAATGRTTGDRWHAVGSVAYPWRDDGSWLIPRLSVNAARYSFTGLVSGQGQHAQRVIPSFSLDAGLALERNTEAFGRALRQTLEPRLLLVNTPYRNQSQLPNYDAAAKDFNFTSIYSDNSFSGIDRVADLQQVTAGFTTRLVDAASGAEALRLGLVQRFLLRDQRVAPQADGSPDGPPLTQKFSDVLLLGSTSVLPGWNLDAAVQYSPDIKRSIRSVLGARYSPGPFRTVGATYRLARGLSEQLEVGWQWPMWGAPPAEPDAGPPARLGPGPSGKPSCVGTWYSVGRMNFSLKDRRLTDAVLGVEYDAGCWIGRLVAEQVSTGRSEATTRYMIQLELVGLSRLGSNPLRVLKENIPGYRLLREDRSGSDRPWSDRSSLSPYYE